MEPYDESKFSDILSQSKYPLPDADRQHHSTKNIPIHWLTSDASRFLAWHDVRLFLVLFPYMLLWLVPTAKRELITPHHTFPLLDTPTSILTSKFQTCDPVFLTNCNIWLLWSLSPTLSLRRRWIVFVDTSTPVWFFNSFVISFLVGVPDYEDFAIKLSLLSVVFRFLPEPGVRPHNPQLISILNKFSLLVSNWV